MNDAINHLFDDDQSKNNNETLHFSAKSNFLLNIASHYSAEARDEKNYHIMKINKIDYDQLSDQLMKINQIDNDQLNDQNR